MKKVSAGMLLVLLTALLVANAQQTAPQPDKWISYTSPEGRYSVSLPEQPTLKTQEPATAEGEKFPQYLAIASDAQITFLVGYFDIAPGSIFSGDLARDAIVKKVAGNLISERGITLGAIPGRDLNVALRLSVPAAEGEPARQIDYVDRMRMYEAGKRIYILQAFFPKEVESDAAARVVKYFDSFQVN